LFYTPQRGELHSNSFARSGFSPNIALQRLLLNAALNTWIMNWLVSGHSWHDLPLRRIIMPLWCVDESDVVISEFDNSQPCPRQIICNTASWQYSRPIISPALAYPVRPPRRKIHLWLVAYFWADQCRLRMTGDGHPIFKHHNIITLRLSGQMNPSEYSCKVFSTVA